MAILDVLSFPDERLRTVAKPVEEVNDEIKQLVSDMFETMKDENGIGLAATQVNRHVQVVVMDVSEDQNEPRVFINPEITRKDGSTTKMAVPLAKKVAFRFQVITRKWNALKRLLLKR